MNVLQVLESTGLPCRRWFAVWVSHEPVLAGLDPRTLRAVLLDASSGADLDRRDDLLAALIRLSRIDDRAGTLLVMCLLPGLRRRINQHGWGLERDEARSVALCALWRRISIYPLHRRPRKIAMNLLMDATHDLIDARNRELRWRANTHLTDRALPQPNHPTPELFWDTARRAGVLNDREIALVHTTRVQDLPLTQIAPLFGMTHDAARKARQRAIGKLKAWWSDAGQQVA